MTASSQEIRPNKKVPKFCVTQPYLNLLVKPRIFFRFSGKNIILCILKGGMPFKMHKIIYFFQMLKNNFKKYVCLPYLNLLVKPRIFFRFSGKNIILCILKGEMPFKMYKIIFFYQILKNSFKKYVCLP